MTLIWRDAKVPFQIEEDYGLGIHLSYHFQWAAAIIAMFIAPEAANKARSGANIITIAVFISSLYGARNEQSLMRVEWYIVQFLVFWLMVFDLAASMFLFLESPGSTAVDLWKKEGCDAFIFLYASISAYNPQWITANKILSIFATTVSWLPLACTIMTLTSAFVREMDELFEDDDDAASPGINYLFGLMMAIFVGLVIFLVEKTISINQIEFPGTSLTDSGQLIPLLIGIFTIVSVLWEGLVNLRQRK